MSAKNVVEFYDKVMRDEELKNNNRSHSAMMRVVQKS